MIQYSFVDKIVLVTGSSRGMGACILEQFAKAGAICILNYFADPAGQNRLDAEATAEKIRDRKGRVHLYEADVASHTSVQAMMEHAKSVVGGLDILVNNAGICRDRTIKKMSLDEWRSVLSTNLDGVFHCCKEGTEILREGGRIVNIASIAGVVGFPGQCNYSAAKAGVIAMTKVLSKELAKRRITVNAIAPGIIQTAMLGEIRPEVVEQYLKQIPAGRLGMPEDIANAVLFLASEESSYITGHTIHITGGWF